MLLRFNINDSSIALSCSHLTAGQDKSEERKNEILYILNSSFKKYPTINFKDYDYYFLFGDINTRLELSINDSMIKELIKNHSTDTNTEFGGLIQHDQFYIYRKENGIIGEMEEAPVRFSPSYKYIVGETNYDISKRIPSWCDRIFYKKWTNTLPLAYNKCLLTLSDHQPIYGLFKIKIETINQQQKQMILNQIIKEKNMYMNNNNQNNNFNNNNQAFNNNFGNNNNNGGNIFNQNNYVENFFK